VTSEVLRRAMSAPIVHPTDFSEGSEPAFVRALELAARDGADLVLVHVLERIPILVDEAGVGPTAASGRDAEVAARKRMDVLLDRAKDLGVVASDVVTEGRPAEAILKVVKAVQASTVVMGTHGRTGLMRLVMGSVAARVFEAALCPVVTVRRT
jgi:nucleotide-binding universal stress UspA family protein